MSDKLPQSLATQLSTTVTSEDWNQIRETIVMLNLATAQVEYSLTDGDDSIDVLTSSFTAMSDGIGSIGESIRSFSQFSEVDQALSNQLLQQCSDLGGKMQSAIVAFQFYDKLVQRLSHVRNSLTQLADLIGDEGQLHEKECWMKLQKNIRAAYTMEEDRQLFDAILAGTSIDEVLKLMTQKKLDDHSVEDDIELF